MELRPDPICLKLSSRLPSTLLNDYLSLAGQPYPLNVRVPFQPRLDKALISPIHDLEMSFEKGHNLYQRVKKCIRLQQDLSQLSWNIN